MKRFLKINIIIFLTIFNFVTIFADEGVAPTTNSDEAPPNVGNFALPPSQQPGPFVSFGQVILDKYESQFFLSYAQAQGDNTSAKILSPALLYGITDTLSLSLFMPIALNLVEDQNHSSGWSDSTLQLEQVVYGNNTYTYSDTITVVGNVSFPTGSANKDPATGLGSSSFFVGTTQNRSYIEWIIFTSEGTLQTTSHDGTKFGNQYLYQLGLEKNIFSKGSSWIFAGLVEADGTYSQKNQASGQMDPNSGGNTLYITPSLWLSSKKTILQVGIGFPVVQNLNGVQNKNNYVVSATFGFVL